MGEALLLVQALPNEVATLSVPSMLVEQNLTSAEETNVEISLKLRRPRPKVDSLFFKNKRN